MLGLGWGVHAQESVFLQQYREKVKALFSSVSIRQEAENRLKGLISSGKCQCQLHG